MFGDFEKTSLCFGNFTRIEFTDFTKCPLNKNLGQKAKVSGEIRTEREGRAGSEMLKLEISGPSSLKEGAKSQ